MAAQGAFGADFYDRSTRTIVGTMLWTEYRPVIKIGPKGALGSHEIRPIHSAPSLGQSIDKGMRSGKYVFKKFNDLKPINVTVTNSVKISQQEKL